MDSFGIRCFIVFLIVMMLCGLVWLVFDGLRQVYVKYLGKYNDLQKNGVKFYTENGIFYAEKVERVNDLCYMIRGQISRVEYGVMDDYLYCKPLLIELR